MTNKVLRYPFLFVTMNAHRFLFRQYSFFHYSVLVDKTPQAQYPANPSLFLSEWYSSD